MDRLPLEGWGRSIDGGDNFVIFGVGEQRLNQGLMEGMPGLVGEDMAPDRHTDQG